MKFKYNIHLVKKTIQTVEQTLPVPVLLYFASISLQIRTKLNKALKTFLIAVICKQYLKIAPDNAFQLKDHISQDLTSGTFRKFYCGLCNECYQGGCVRQVSGRTGEDIDTSPIMKKNVDLKNRHVSDHLQFYNNLASFNDLSVLNRKTKKF